MTASALIASGLARGLLALTPVQRWQAAQRFSGSFITERWFLVAVLVVMFTLGALLLVVSVYKTVRELKTTENLFEDSARQRGLSEDECQLLLAVATKAGLRRGEAIYTMAGAFDRGADAMVGEHLKSRSSPEQTKQLKNELAGLREKLGFRRHKAAAQLTTRSRQLGTRQIPVGKELIIKTAANEQINGADILCTVVRNTDVEFAVKLGSRLETGTGQSWTLRYDFGASVWEFEAAVVSCSGETVVFNHCDSIRFISHRRFPRIPVQRYGLIAAFPFAKTVTAEDDRQQSPQGIDTQSDREPASAESCCGPPQFADAVVTELGGPGLRIETSLNVKAGDRVLVLFRLGEEDGSAHAAANKMKILQSVGIVRDVAETAAGGKSKENRSVAVELVTLNESDLNELIRITNAAAVRAGHKSAEAGNSTDEPELAVQAVEARES